VGEGPLEDRDTRARAIEAIAAWIDDYRIQRPTSHSHIRELRDRQRVPRAAPT
jgi:hypothetical protein